MALIQSVKVCGTCRQSVPTTGFYPDVSKKDGLGRECKVCCRGRLDQWRKNNPEKHKESKRRWYLQNPDKKRMSGWREKGIVITLSTHADLLSKQNYRCAICDRHESELTKALGVDHCHATGKIRGLLCTNCNSAIGQLHDDLNLLKKAVNYLESYVNSI